MGASLGAGKLGEGRWFIGRRISGPRGTCSVTSFVEYIEAMRGCVRQDSTGAHRIVLCLSIACNIVSIERLQFLVRGKDILFSTRSIVSKTVSTCAKALRWLGRWMGLKTYSKFDSSRSTDTKYIISRQMKKGGLCYTPRSYLYVQYKYGTSISRITSPLIFFKNSDKLRKFMAEKREKKQKESHHTVIVV